MKIRNYPINPNLTDRDMLVGTDSNGLTKNFLIGSISEFITSGVAPSIILAADFLELQTITPSVVSLGITLDTNKLYYFNSVWVPTT